MRSEAAASTAETNKTAPFLGGGHGSQHAGNMRPGRKKKGGKLLLDVDVPATSREKGGSNPPAAAKAEMQRNREG